MTSVAINREWFNEIKSMVEYKDEYYYTDASNRAMVEVDVNEEQFNKVSKELGWML